MTKNNSNSTPKITDGDNLRKILKQTSWIWIHNCDRNGRAKWILYSEWHPGFRLAEGQINLIDNYAHLEQVEGIRRHFEVSDDVDIHEIVIDMVENRGEKGLQTTKVDRPDRIRQFALQTLDATAYPEDLEMSIWSVLRDMPIDTMINKVLTLTEGLISTKEVVKTDTDSFEINCMVDGWQIAVVDTVTLVDFLLDREPELVWE
jgi:hypothetical protein